MFYLHLNLVVLLYTGQASGIQKEILQLQCATGV
jgi:hypothetical protein